MSTKTKRNLLWIAIAFLASFICIASACDIVQCEDDYDFCSEGCHTAETEKDEDRCYDYCLDEYDECTGGGCS